MSNVKNDDDWEWLRGVIKEMEFQDKNGIGGGGGYSPSYTADPWKKADAMKRHEEECPKRIWRR
jgi:hypothetical protein